MFSRAQVILGRFVRQVEKMDNANPLEETEEQEYDVVHTFGDLNQYQDVILVDVEEN